MGKWLVIYSSVTGNTKCVAEAMAEKMQDADVFSVDKVPEDFSMYEVVVIGYWLRRGTPDERTQAFLPTIHDKAVALFETHGAQPYSEHTITAFARAAYLLGEGCNILGTFACQGKINPALIAMRKRGGADDPHANTEENAARWALAAGHPNEVDLAAAADFAGRLYQKLETWKKYHEKIQRS